MSSTPSKFKIVDLWPMIKQTYKYWNADGPWRLSAVVAYYAILSLPGLLIILINAVGAIWGQEIVQGHLHGEISSALGPDAADSIQGMLADTSGEKKSIIANIIGIAALVFGATGVFYQLQVSLNKVWELESDPKGGIKKMLFDRARSFGVILVIGFLLTISFVISAGIALLNDFISNLLPDGSTTIALIIDVIVNIGILTILFGLIFKYLPDAKIRWKTVWIGSIITAILFVLGKYLLGLYFGQTDPGSTYGAAGSVILVLLWVSYSSLILFFGAEFTYVYAEKYGHGIEPSKNAIRVEHKKIIVDQGSEAKGKVDEESESSKKGK